MTTTKEESADTRVKVSLIKEAIAEIEAVVHKHLPAPKWRRSNAIYCFRLLKCGRWLPLNRAYQPLGYGGLGITDAWSPTAALARSGYPLEAHADRAVLFPGDPHKLDGVWWKAQGDTLYFDNGSPASRKSYRRRFARLVAMIIVGRAMGLPAMPEAA
jgi:hypothetical protein